MNKYLLFGAGLVAGMAFLYWASGTSFSEENMIIKKMAWSENCNAIDVEADFAGISEKQLQGMGQEIQCKVILDGIDNYEQDNAYYCNIQDGLKTAIKTDINKNHIVTLCCGITGFDNMTCKTELVKSCGLQI